MKEVKSPEIYHVDKQVTVFLAGGITSCPNWQQEVVQSVSDMTGVIYNPRRDDFDVNDKSASFAQIEWEFNMMKKSHIIVFWFPEESVCPISLLELGKCNATQPQNGLIVGTHKFYSRRLDVIEQSRLAGRLQDANKIYDSLSETIDMLRIRIEHYQLSK